ncbi:YybH family protein [Hymenobacter jejuensis]|uniref:DUF3225 domain-containing protein n=1 Tax=Hymenobacter jejuensis TaxID=2502781 RepID=A0A5B8A2W9_9BACT|nr:DUF4440 domain-containing protein [Hymenobacter jejuensis]QDA61005.1 DUF3225 domain-containing protein [Hymenobacter jejuensis]
MEIIDTLLDEIRHANDQFENSFDRGDVVAIASLYTKEGSLLPPGSGPITGSEAIASFWKGGMDMGIKQVRLHSMEVESFGDTAIELGQYRLNGAEGQQMDYGKYIVMWKKEGNDWKIQRDIWNTSGE